MSTPSPDPADKLTEDGKRAVEAYVQRYLERKPELSELDKLRVERHISRCLKGAVIMMLAVLGGGGFAMWQFVERVATTAGQQAARQDSVVGEAEKTKNRIVDLLDDVTGQAWAANQKVADAVATAKAAADGSGEARRTADSAKESALESKRRIDAALEALRGNAEDAGRALASLIETDQVLREKLGAAAIKGYSERVEKLEAAVLAAAQASIPIGGVLAWPSELKKGMNGEVDGMPGWTVCDGSWLYSVVYPEAARVLGKRYAHPGEAGLPEQFKIPDFRGYFLRGLDPKGDVDESARAIGGRPQMDAIGAHQEGYRLMASATAIQTDPPIRSIEEDPSVYNNGKRLAHTQIGAQVPRMETRPKNYAVHWVIRIK